MSSIRAGGYFLAVAVAVGLVVFWVEYGSPIVYFLIPWLLAVNILFAALHAGLVFSAQRWWTYRRVRWAIPILLYGLSVSLFNGLFIPGLSPDWFTYSLWLCAANIGLPSVLSILFTRVSIGDDKEHCENNSDSASPVA